MAGELSTDLDAFAATLGNDLAPGQTFCPPEIARTAAGDAATSTLQWLEQQRAPPERPASRGDAFRRVAKIGEGGMGVVYRGFQASLGREVAIKEVAADDPGLVAQALSEAGIMGRLEHANIIPVHELGSTADGRPQIAMRLVRGTSWLELLHGARASELSLDDHLDVLQKVCNAVAFAHERGFLHRDLKPENVMVGAHGEVFVMDWGVAVATDRALARESGILYAGDAASPAGTPGYMAPELARGDGPAQGPHTDVYLLGACLHEVLTRNRRHDGPTLRAVLESATTSPPFEYGPGVPRELAAICNRATEKDSARRYPDVASFAAAVRAYLEHREAQGLLDEGLALAARLEADIARHAAAPAGERDAIDVAIHRAHAEARFALERARSLWSENPTPAERLRAIGAAVVRHALATEDLGLAVRTLPECGEDAALADAVGRLKAKLERRAGELASLRAEARRQDWSPVAAPLGNAFIAGGVVGGGTLVATRYVAALPSARLAVLALWVTFSVGLGAFAFWRLRRAKVPDSLVSPRMFATWAAVGAGAFLSGLSNEVRGLPQFHDACYSAWMIAIGFVATAYQTRRWLLAAAAAFAAGGVTMAFVPERSAVVFGGLWLAVMCGVGVALRLGATLDEKPDAAA